MRRLDLVIDVVIVPLINLLLPKNLSLQLLLVPIGQFLRVLVVSQQQLPIGDVLLLSCDLFLVLIGGLEAMQIGTFIHQDLLLRMDIKTHTFQRKIAPNAVREGKRKRRRVYRRG